MTEGAVDTIPEAHETLNTQSLARLQVEILQDDADVDAFVQTISTARFNKYLREHDGNKRSAIALYHANAKISQCLYLPIQIWEIALRNRLSAFLSWKYNPGWPWDARLVRNLSKSESRRLADTLERQIRSRGGRAKTSTDHVVADLSAGFWVGLLTKSYEASFAWRHNLARVFPANPKIGRDEAYRICNDLLDLRNRIAHHESIYHLPLQDRHADMTAIIAALCDRQKAYHSYATTFPTDWAGVRACLKAGVKPTVDQ